MAAIYPTMMTRSKVVKVKFMEVGKMKKRVTVQIFNGIGNIWYIKI